MTFLCLVSLTYGATWDSVLPVKAHPLFWVSSERKALDKCTAPPCSADMFSCWKLRFLNFHTFLLASSSCLALSYILTSFKYCAFVNRLKHFCAHKNMESDNYLQNMHRKRVKAILLHYRESEILHQQGLARGMSPIRNPDLSFQSWKLFCHDWAGTFICTQKKWEVDFPSLLEKIQPPHLKWKGNPPVQITFGNLPHATIASI